MDITDNFVKHLSVGNFDLSALIAVQGTHAEITVKQLSSILRMIFFLFFLLVLAFHFCIFIAFICATAAAGLNM